MTLKNSFFLSVLILFLSVSLFSCKRNSTSDFFRNSDFNAHWEFHMGDISDPSNPSKDESAWYRKDYVTLDNNEGKQIIRINYQGSRISAVGIRRKIG